MSQPFEALGRGIKQFVLDGDVPPVIGHYAHVVELTNGMVYVSGQKAWRGPSGEMAKGDVSAQTELIFDNLEAILAKVGLGLANVIRIGCHLRDISDYEAFNEVYAKRLGKLRPVRAVLGGYELRDGARVELVVEAYRG